METVFVRYRLWKSAGQSGKGADQNSQPVSYTHLDVYKRQMHTLKEAGLVQNADATTLSEAVDAICEAFGVEDRSAGNSGTEDHSTENSGIEKETDRC